MRDKSGSIVRWTFVAALTLATSACSTLPQAIDSVRWTTPLDAKQETLTVTDAVTDARKTGSEEHKAILEKDAAALKAAGEAATEREDKQRGELKKRIEELEAAQAGAIAAIGGLFPGAGQTLAAALGQGFGKTTRDADEAKETAKGAFDEVGRVAKSTDAVATKLSEVEKLVAQLGPETIAALRKLDLAELDKIAKTGNRDAVIEAIRSELAKLGLPPERIEELIAKTEGMSIEEIMALIGTLIGGGALGTAGGRMLSGSGKRIDGAKKEIGELYDEVAKLRERNAQIEAKQK